MALKALALNCTLKEDIHQESSTDALIAVLTKAFNTHGVRVSETARVAALDIKAGVTSDEGDGDAWPALRDKILAHVILIFGGPIWMGQISSNAKRLLERMNALLSETDDEGRTPSYGKVAVASIVGNEDGAHFSSAQLFQTLNDVGWTIPAVATRYWVGEAMGSVDFKDLDSTPDIVTKTANIVDANAANLARLLQSSPYPG
ncbi:NAD(P)H-dependent oxidoreductase [Sphingobium sp. H39-3-25]|uniref:flavodoxin family protein n=1 Tax=Sphingobium arseniciresistens TaxID=3030834 RepID=UPI0023B8B103|nr:NAD(P)H-dependent oxidoreductase [Sphingobium arseniciresistens]